VSAKIGCSDFKTLKDGNREGTLCLWWTSN
jgi:hypothetical protein